ncbi:MAG: hypothetical protein ORN85_00405 [Sediminibacterium sp.]|nr:hypothetical protein [Sediminibacterium sp.]
MNILEIVPYSLFPIRNAGQESIIQFSSYLNDYGNVFVASVEIHPDLIKDYKITTYFPVFPNKKKRYLPLYNFFKLNKIIQENNINVLIVDHPYMALTTHFLAVKNKIPWFLRSHNIESDRFKSLQKWWFKLL